MILYIILAGVVAWFLVRVCLTTTVGYDADAELWTNCDASLQKSFAPQRVCNAVSAEDVSGAVVRAKRDKRTLRVVGSSTHRNPALVSEADALVVMQSVNSVEDCGGGVISVGCGATVEKLFFELAARGRSWYASPMKSCLTVGGVLALGEGGSTLHSAPLAAHVISLDVITSDGAERTLTPEKDADLLRAAVVSCGAGCIMLRARFSLESFPALVPLRQDVVDVESTEGMLERLNEYVHANSSAASSSSDAETQKSRHEECVHWSCVWFPGVTPRGQSIVYTAHRPTTEEARKSYAFLATTLTNGLLDAVDYTRRGFLVNMAWAFLFTLLATRWNALVHAAVRALFRYGRWSGVYEAEETAWHIVVPDYFDSASALSYSVPLSQGAAYIRKLEAFLKKNGPASDYCNVCVTVSVTRRAIGAALTPFLLAESSGDRLHLTLMTTESARRVEPFWRKLSEEVFSDGQACVARHGSVQLRDPAYADEWKRAIRQMDPTGVFAPKPSVRKWLSYT